MVIIKRVFCVISVLSFIFVGIGNAVPFTTMGLMKVPEAYVLPANMAEFSISGYLYNEHSDGKKAPGTQNLPDEWNRVTAFTLNYGYKDRAEIGIVYNMMPKIDSLKEKANWANDKPAFKDDNIEKDIFYVNLKLNLLKETAKYPAVSVGIENLFSEKNIDEIYRDKYKEVGKKDEFFSHDMDDYRKNSFYISATKATILRNIPKFKDLEVYGTAGIGFGRFVGASDDKNALRGIFIGLNAKLSDKFYFAVEEDGYSFNTGIQYNIGNVSTKLGIYRVDELLTWNHNPRVSFALQYTFDAYSQKKASEKLPSIAGLGEGTTEKVATYREKGTTGKTSGLEQELEKIREKRRKAQKDLEELRKLLEE